MMTNYLHPHRNPRTFHGTNLLALLSFISGLLTIIHIPLAWIAAIVLGILAKKQLQEPNSGTGESFATAGLIIGIVIPALDMIVGVLFVIGMFTAHIWK